MNKYIILILLFLVSYAIADTGAKVGFAYLKIGADARAAAMGEAYTSIANDAAATYWNPAGLAAAQSNSIVLMHNAWLQGVNHEFAAVHLFQGKHNVAFSLNMIHVSGISLRGERATDTPDGETSAYNANLAMSYASTFFNDWKIGVQIKYLYEKYYLSSANGFALDIGILKTNILPDISWGVTLQNIGKMNKLRLEETKLPVILRTGISYILPWRVLDNRPQIATDFVYVNDDVSHLNVGLNTGIYKNFEFRLGYILGRDGFDFTTGFGVSYKGYNISYAFVPYHFDLGNSHRFSVIIDF